MGGLDLEHHLDLNDHEELQGLKNQTNMEGEEIQRLVGLEHRLDLKDEELQRLQKQINMQGEEIQRLKSKTDMQGEEIQRLINSQTDKQQESLINQLIDMAQKDIQHLRKQINLLEKDISKINGSINRRPPLPRAAPEEVELGLPHEELGEQHLLGAIPSPYIEGRRQIENKFREQDLLGATPSPNMEGPPTPRSVAQSSSQTVDLAEDEVNGDTDARESSSVYPYERLKVDSSNPVKGIDVTRREDYLGEEEFQERFQMPKEEFYKLPKWKQNRLKMSLRLF